MSLRKRHSFGIFLAIVLIFILLLPKCTQAGFPNCTAHSTTIESFPAKIYPDQLLFLQTDMGKLMANMTCGMIVTAPSDKIIAFQFMLVHWSSVNDTCIPGEYLEIFDGTSSANKSIHRECKGIAHSTTYFTSGPNGYVELRTSLKTNKTFVGIRIIAVDPSVCTGLTTLQASNSTENITSPYYSYDLGYSPNATCSWRITAPPNHVVRIQADSSVNCNGNDQLEIYSSMNATTERLLGRLCYSPGKPYTIFTSTGQDIFVSFRSNVTFQDRWRHRRYFVLYYNSYKPACRGGELTTVNATSPIKVIRSPKDGASLDYPRNSNCSWRITAPPDHVIKLEVVSKVWCDVNDYLKIYDSDSNVAEDLLDTPCRSSRKKVYYSTGQDVYISFTSSAVAISSWSEYSFTVEYSAFKPGTTCSPANTADQNKNIVIRGPGTGVIQSPHFPHKFPNNLYCTWKFRAPPNHVVKLYFDTIDLKASSCLVSSSTELKVEDGYPENSPLLDYVRCYSTSMVSMKQSFTSVSSGKALAARFVTGSTTIQGYGFQANFTMLPVKVVSTATCGEQRTGFIHLTAQASSIRSPGFSNAYGSKHPKNMTCVWTITVDPGYVIKVQVKYNNLKLGCSSDEYARFIDGGNMNSSTMFTLCNRNTPDTTYSTGNNVMIELKTSSSDERGSGFLLSYMAVKAAPLSYSCSSNSATYLKDSTFRIASFNYPLSYPNNAFCRWAYRATFGKRARLNITKLELQESANCEADYVRVFGSNYYFTPKLGQFCGKPKTPIVLTSTGDSLAVDFRSDWMGRFPGFEGTFEGIQDDSIGSCNVQGRDNLIPLNGTSGTFFSPRYPNTVPKSMSCIWHITAAKGSHFKLTIRDFNLDYFCKNDYLEVRTGSPQDPSSKLIGRYCGHKEVPSIFSPGNSLWIHYKSNDQLSTSRGFTATYAEVSALPLSISCRSSGQQKIKSASGQIATYDYPLKYENNVSCKWYITVDSSKRVKFTFDSFSLEDSSGCNGDHVAFYDGYFGDLIGKYCGSKTPDPVYSSGSTLYIKFATDGKGRYKGFKGSFESVLSVRTIIMIVVFTLIGVGLLFSLIGWCIKGRCLGMCSSGPQPLPADGTSVAGSNFQLTTMPTEK